MTYTELSGFSAAELEIAHHLAGAKDVHVGEWQAIKGDIPQADTIELEDVTIMTALPPKMADWQFLIAPNLPWAEDHFQERISGIPYNPPPSAKYWPFAQKNNEEHKKEGIFSHTYPERFWPKTAGEQPLSTWHNRVGIRYPWGDLNDVVELLRRSPGTRQAYLPVWFPEDTGAMAEQRVPCTLGYHFMIRDGALKVVYYIRSCDFFRHFRDDAYMAGRLGQWIAEELGVTTSRLVMHISSLHVFSIERSRIVAFVDEGDRAGIA